MIGLYILRISTPGPYKISSIKIDHVDTHRQDRGKKAPTHLYFKPVTYFCCLGAATGLLAALRNNTTRGSCFENLGRSEHGV